MVNERGLRELIEHADRQLHYLRAEQLVAVVPDYGKGGVRLHLDRAAVLAGQRYLKKEYGSASKKAAKG